MSLLERKSKINRKEQIALAVLKFVAEKGFRGATMEDIANACNFRPSAIYKHYRNKRACFLAACEHLNHENVDLYERHYFIVRSCIDGMKSDLVSHATFFDVDIRASFDFVRDMSKS